MEKLNKIERLKAACKPVDYDIYSVNWGNPSEEERFYLKSYGIYNIKLRPEVYMLRLRIDGGRVDREMLKALAKYADTNGYRLIITARAQLEVHGIEAADMPKAYEEVRQMGWEMRQTLTDNFRAIVTDPYDGVAMDSEIGCLPIIDKIREQILGNREWMGTIPRKFNTVIIGRRTPVVNPWGNDLLFALAQKDGQYGFNIYLGGKNNQTAKSADIFVLPPQAYDLFFAVAKVFDRHGLRGSRSKNRLYFLIEYLGMDEVRALIGQEYGSVLEKAGELLMNRSHSSKYTKLTSGNRGEMIESDRGEIDISMLLRLLEEMSNKDELRLGADQNIHLVASRRFEEEGENVPTITACAGERYCPLSLWDIKRDTDMLPTERLRELGVSVGFSGCLKGCGRHLHSDIGLVGLRTNLYGETERALRVYIGALQGEDGQPARLLYFSVPRRSFGDLMNVILDEFESSGANTFEEFSRSVLSRFDDEWLQLWFLLKIDGTADAHLGMYQSQDEATEHLYKNGIVDPNSQMSDIIRDISHKAWDNKTGQ